MKILTTVCTVFLCILITTSGQAGLLGCGGDGQVSCLGFCDLWHDADANDICRHCGFEGEDRCADSLCYWGLFYDWKMGVCTSECGREGQVSCWGSCDPGLAVGSNLLCTPCGDEDQIPCWYRQCNDGFALNNSSNIPLLGEICTLCGGDGILKCADDPPCQQWRTVNPYYPDYCIACGNDGQLACDYDSLQTPGLCRDENSEISEDGRCEPCGGVGEPKCADPGTTNTGMAENDDVFEVPKQEPGPNEPLWGFVDAHEHQFANDAYGGAMFWGKPFSAGGINKALASCDYTWDFKTEPSILHTGLFVTALGANVALLLDPITAGWGALLTGWATAELIAPFTVVGAGLDGRGFPVHGQNWATFIPNHPIPTQILDGFTVNMATNSSPFPLHHVPGADNFYRNTDEDRGWPHYLDGGHQQMYYKWLERSYQAGLRLLVNMPVNNEILCASSIQRTGYSCDDMESAYIQINSIKALERFIDLEDDGDINGTGWYRIAYSPQEAREIIKDGAMAVIISIEVDSLFGCKPGTENTFCTKEYIEAQIDKLYDAGVRHLFPVHLFDNAFSGAAFYSDIFAIANTIATGDIFEPYDCGDDDEGYAWRFKAGIDEDAFFDDWDLTDISDGGSIYFNLLYSPLASLYGADIDLLSSSFFNVLGDTDRGADCNSKGVTSIGETLLDALMDKGMLIDIDHFSHKAMRPVLDVLKSRNYPPVSSHTVILPDVLVPLSDRLRDERARSELGISRSLAKDIIKMGGHIAVNPSRPNHADNGYEGGTAKQFVYGQHRQFVDNDGLLQLVDNDELPDNDGLPYNKRILGYNDIITLIDEAYKELKDNDAAWEYPREYHISFVGDFGAFVDQPEPRFKEVDVAGYWQSKCAPGSLIVNLPQECTTTPSFDDPEEEPNSITSITCPASSFDAADLALFLPQKCLLGVDNDDGRMTIFLDIAPPLQYPFDGFEPVDKGDPDGPKIGKFYRQTTGTRTFDFNTDGLAHYGLVPDLLADARDNYGADLTKLFHSAEAFISMWERVYVDTDCQDTDFDDVCDYKDACPGYDDSLDADGDGFPDDCDSCPNDPLNDSDADGYCHEDDNCPGTANNDQADQDNDGWGDACDPDDDNDGVPDVDDQCPQEDATGADADRDGCIDSFAGLYGFIEILVDTERLDANLYNPLSKKIANAEKSVGKGNICAAINQINAFINQVNGKTGKKISVDVAYHLIEYGNNLIFQLRADLPEGETCRKGR